MTAAAILPLELNTTINEPGQRYARLIALFMLASLIFGGLGEAYIPSKIIVSGDATATASNILNSPMLFRLGFATYLVEAICDVALALLFYALLRPVNRNLALFTAFLGLISTTLYAVAEAFYFAPTIILSGADYLKTFSPEQLNSLSYLSLRLFNKIAGLYLAFYGLGMAIRGYLIYRSRYLPKVLGVLLAIGGTGFIVQTLATVLAPQYVSNLLLLPMAAAGLTLMLWLFVRGVDVEKWHAAR